ncbi:MAG: SH3 domain-containing protein [Pseudomonadota bacterium]
MMGRVRIFFIAAAALILGACESLPIGGLGGGGDNYAQGSALAGELSGSDREAVKTAFMAALSNGAPQSWRGRRANGVVSPGDFALGNLLSDSAALIPAARADFDLTPTLETEQGPYAVRSTVNVRLGPGTEYTAVEQFSGGDSIDVVGRVVGSSWMLAAKDGVIRGYVHGSLVMKAPGGDLTLAGGPRRRAILCREFSQRMTVSGARDDWTGAACRNAEGEWRLQVQPEGPTSLLGY